MTTEFKQKILEYADSNIDSNIIDEYCATFEKMVLDFSKKSVKLDTNKIINSIGTPDYINRICEFCIAHYFMMEYPENFQYEVESNLAKTQNINDKRKNFDLSFISNKYTFNIEVKTFKLTNHENKDPIKLYLPPEQSKPFYDLLKENNINISRNCLPQLGRFLRDANSQLPDKTENHINIVMLCCNDLDEYSDVLTCLLHPKIGVFYIEEPTKISPNLAELDKIDCICINNLGFEHNVIFDYERYMRSYGKENVTNGIINLSGSEIWNYYRNIPILPIAFFPKKLSDELNIEIDKTLFSQMFFYQKCWIENNDYADQIQKSLFDAYNEILKKS